jgi:hypothetical protein
LTTLNLTINTPPAAVNITASAIGSYTWNGTTYTNSGTYNFFTMNAAGCDSLTRLHLTITPATDTWTGAVSTDWNTAGNWSNNAVPTSTTDATIPKVANQPVIGATASARNITIGSGATVTNNSTLNVYGNWKNSGSFAAGTGTVTLNGTTDTLTGYNTFNNLTIAGTYIIGTAATDTVAVTGILSLGTGSFATNNKLTLKSTSSKTALIAENEGNLTGKIRVERYISGSTGYHHLSSPASDAFVSNWMPYFPIVGTNSVNASLKGQGGSLQVYREAGNIYTVLDSNYYNYTSPDNSLTPAKGFVARLNTLPITLATYGTPNNGTVTIQATSSSSSNVNVRGWNLLGNPYPSPISWTALKALNPTAFGDPSCYIWKSTGGLNGVWQTYNGTAGTNGVGNVIASSQGFFVYVNSTSTITYNNTVRTQDLSPTFFSSTQPREVRLSIVNPSNTDESDEIVAYTKTSADETSSIKPAQPLEATNPTIAFVIGGKEVGIHTADVLNGNTELPLSIKTPYVGIYTLKLGNYNAGMPIYLKDNLKNIYTDLQAGEATIQTTKAVTAGRYSIVFKKAIGDVIANQYNVFSSNHSIVVTNATPVTNTRVLVYNSIGQLITQATMNGTTVTIPVSNNLTAYVVKVVGANGTVAKSQMVENN